MVCFRVVCCRYVLVGLLYIGCSRFARCFGFGYWLLAPRAWVLCELCLDDWFVCLICVSLWLAVCFWVS